MSGNEFVNQFSSFDPLTVKQAVNTEVAANAIKREIKNILNSYVGWFDPFCELIQNSLDAVEAKAERMGQHEASKKFEPEIWITINIKENSLIVTDNGIGLTEKQFNQFLAPNFSFKSGKTRGHKGVGATYLAYGFNYMSIATKADGFSTCGKIDGAKKWLDDENPSGNPEVSYDGEGSKDPIFNRIESGVSIYIRFDKTTVPGTLQWINATKANQWKALLTAKTGLGAIRPNPDIKINIIVVDQSGEEDRISYKGIAYDFLRERTTIRAVSYRELEAFINILHSKHGPNYQLPAKFKNLDAIYESWEKDELIKLLNLKDEEKKICENYTPLVSVEYVYSAKLWQTYNNGLHIRAKQNALSPGIQVAANNMPQGEVTQITLQKYTGLQNQVHFLIHFDNCSADLGRKGFKKEITDFAKEISGQICDKILPKYKKCLRAATGVAPDLVRQQTIDDWKREMEKHEAEQPLSLIHEHFFHPSKKISITSTPTREQDVIALFNQIIAGGVIRGIKIMSTNERMVYDGLYRVCYEEPNEQHIYHPSNNPLGVEKGIAEGHTSFKSGAKILEYKFSLDGLIEDFSNGTKNDSDINLVVAWETGEDYKSKYKITSLLDDDNLNLRQFHGATHMLNHIENSQFVSWLVVLSELIDFLNDPEKTRKSQIGKYENY